MRYRSIRDIGGVRDAIIETLDRRVELIRYRGAVVSQLEACVFVLVSRRLDLRTVRR